jgi:hypothetical protein
MSLIPDSSLSPSSAPCDHAVAKRARSAPWRGVCSALASVLGGAARRLSPSVTIATPPGEPPVQDLGKAAAFLVNALDHGDGTNTIAHALGQLCAAPPCMRTANELKKLETHLINRVHKESLPLMCNWLGQPKLHFGAIHRAVLDNHGFAAVYALPTAQDKYPYVNQRALVAALGTISARLADLT